MRIASVKVENFRAHSLTEIPLKQLGCLIGENNAGKSTLLHAIQFGLEDRKVGAGDFKDEAEPITVTLCLEGISKQDLERIGEQHRTKVADMIEEGNLTIVRSQGIGSKPESKYLKKVPRDSSWEISNLNEATKNKSGANLRSAAVNLKPELDALLSDKPKKSDVVSAWNTLIAGLPIEELELQAVPFPTGIATAVKPLFPSIIYIEAVKDASLEAKSMGTSAFSKLLGILFEEVQEQFEDIEAQFSSVHQKLSRFVGVDGTDIDNRLPAVKRIEETIEQYVASSFPGVKIRMDVPAPTLTMLLDSADLLIDDGHLGSVATKGDGLKRTVLFALLRAYANLRDQGLSDADGLVKETGIKKIARPYLLLFEEPELYLHPRAQRQLMDALSSFSKGHQVLVTTHSPGFFQPGTEGFTKLQKTTEGVNATPVDLTLDLRDSYQVVRHENNEAAFFAQNVVLVEGDSDTFVYPHIAKLISAEWDNVEKNIVFVKIDGKGNITRYREFFNSFGITVHVISDLDAISDGFRHLTATDFIRDEHANLMNLVSIHLETPNELNKKKAQNLTKTRTNRELWIAAQEHFYAWGKTKDEEEASQIQLILSELFDYGQGNAKLKHLKSPPTTEIEQSIDKVINSLAKESTYVLRRGDLEDYCGTTGGAGKVSAAIAFCESTPTLDAFKKIHGVDASGVIEELTLIFRSIYGAPVANSM